MRKIAVLGWCALAASALAQGWTGAYEAGLASAKAAKWSEARISFKQAGAYRPEDVSGETVLPGPISERRRWRNGAPYSPNFLAAYAGYKQAQTLTGDDRSAVMTDIVGEFEGILAQNQLSPAAFYFLNQIFVQTGNTEKRLKLEEQFKASAGKLNWRVDGEGMAPEDAAAVAQTYAGAGAAPVGNSVPIVNAGTPTVITTPPKTGGLPTAPPTVGPVPAMGHKYALIIGNTESRVSEAGLSFGSDDAQKIRESLQTNGGYLESNIDLILNATADQMKASINAMAARVPEDAVIFIYFTGVGVNLDGRDFIAGVDTASLTDTSSMVAKADIYAPFMTKGAKVFAFFQVSRPVVAGRYFGSEVPLVGRISQMQATLPGAAAASYTRNGKGIGLFTDAIAGVLADLRSNQIPIQEFGWQVFYRMKRGGSGNFGGGSNQTPTLPVLINLASDAKF